MLELLQRGRDRYNLAVLAIFMVVLLLFGGASRVDVVGQAVVRVAAVLVLVSSFLQFDAEAFKRVRLPLVFVTMFGAVIALQLVPLPPGVWASLPGRGEHYLAALSSIGADQVWRPLSVSPDRTLNALLALLPPVATLAVLGLFPASVQRVVLVMLLVAIGISALLGMLQIATGGPYLYSITNYGAAVGAFANRNHAALFVALSLPLLAGWYALVERRSGTVGISNWVALCASIAVFPVLLVTGSRGGLLLGAVGAVSALVIVLNSGMRMSRQRRLATMGTALLIAAATIVVFVVFSRDEALQRLMGDERELRAGLLPLFVRMIGDYFPFGSGFGSFEYVYRMYEPRSFLDPYYLNQAHNDLAQVLIEGGLPALLVTGAFAAWACGGALSAWRAPVDSLGIIRRVASAAIAMIAIGSLFDYPLRSPLMAVTASIVTAWLALRQDDHPRWEQDREELLGKSRRVR